jgi:FAD/FMN-containing dehydrogenase
VAFPLEAVNDLASSFTGELLQPTDTAYDDARRVHNGLVDKRPALIARCRGAADVADAVKLARRTGLEIAVRGGGHNVAGRATVEAGLMIDLSQMRGIHVDPAARTARAQGGVLWKAFNRETQAHGLATTGGVVSSTGVAGLTLGGGIGWLMPKYGLALDNLLSVDVVTADGSLLRASEDENPDLFWALRGGGGNFGVATSLEYAVHPVGPVIAGGLVAYPFAKAPEVLRFFREACADLPDEMMLVAGLITGPDGGKLVGIVACHCGDLETGLAALQPIKAFDAPVLDTVGPVPYGVLNTVLDESFPKGALNYWKAQFVRELSDESIDTLVDAYARCPSPMAQIVVEHFHGAASRVPVDATACALRVEGFNVVLASQWNDATQTAPCVAWGRASYEAMRPFFGSTRYVNYLADDEFDGAAAAVYGPNLPRLRAIKAQYDPENVFHLNVNIAPRA